MATAKTQGPKALTIRQPWAELILRGRKLYELRGWRTHYRGPLVIHASARVQAEDARLLGLDPNRLPTSCFLGVVDVKDVGPFTRRHAKILRQRRALAEPWWPDYFAWEVRNPRRFRKPIKGKGKLSFFKLPQSVRRELARLLPNPRQ